MENPILLIDRKDLKQKPFGFWRSSNEPDLPVVHESIFDNHSILMNLGDIERKIKEKTLIDSEYLAYRGMSQCRCCGQLNGNATYTVKAGDTVYSWPSGLWHYLEDHYIEPPEYLRELVENYDLELMPVEPCRDLFPFEEFNVEDDEVVAHWNEIREKGTMYSRIHVTVKSKTEMRMRVTADGEDEPVFEKDLTVDPSVLESIIYSRQMLLAGEQYNERKHLIRAHETRRLMVQMFGEQNGSR